MAIPMALPMGSSWIRRGFPQRCPVHRRPPAPEQAVAVAVAALLPPSAMRKEEPRRSMAPGSGPRTTCTVYYRSSSVVNQGPSTRQETHSGQPCRVAQQAAICLMDVGKRFWCSAEGWGDSHSFSNDVHSCSAVQVEKVVGGAASLSQRKGIFNRPADVGFGLGYCVEERFAPRHVGGNGR